MTLKHFCHQATHTLAVGLASLFSFVPLSHTEDAPGVGDEYRDVETSGSREPNDDPPLPTKIRIHESQIIRPVTDRLLGFNYDWLYSERLIIDREKGGINENYLDKLKGLSLPLNRVAGTDSQAFEWKKAIGPFARRVPQKVWPHDKQSQKLCGPLEWVDATLKIDPDAEFTWCLNLEKDSPQDAADLAELFLGRAESEWGAKRLDYGLKQPVRIAIWELGNEMDWGDHREQWPVDRYIDVCRRTMDAIEAVDPEAKFAVHASTAPWAPIHKKTDGGWAAWHRAVLRALGDRIDYVTIHPYYQGLSMPVIEEYLDTLRDDIRDITADDRIQVYISEHARWPERPQDESVSWRTNWYQTHSLEGCLASAEFINRILSRPEITAAAYHSISSGPWGVIKITDDGEIYRTAVYDLFHTLNQAFGQSVVTTQVEGERTDPKVGGLYFTATAMTTADKGLNLLLVNREDSASRPITFQAEGDYKIVEAITFTGPGLDAYNTPSDRPVGVESMSPDQLMENYLVPARSIVVLRCRPMTGAE